MENKPKTQQELTELLNSTLLPMIVAGDGTHIEYIFICSMISGQANYKDDMPLQLALTRFDEDGTETTKMYFQSDIEIESKEEKNLATGDKTEDMKLNDDGVFYTV